eukprot:CAMPEP_0170525550 /NCGR_PEP_ID=MMETSP0209-20121228/10989_1 /TAXON_ID=665100 ORGANISM="Litonotus pictus, Strain P1" /NCGR_SAMPLE_ID=MMETSP0209 /ASSEMBLY_ACC=CAM_ASM_000301 /LENGTH=388 /DNA_ID=CAMNT_0010814839 /DNA_START=1053 /DNA_END=2216 /DNA_ORIENTATION=+
MKKEPSRNLRSLIETETPVEEEEETNSESSTEIIQETEPKNTQTPKPQPDYKFNSFYLNIGNVQSDFLSFEQCEDKSVYLQVQNPVDIDQAVSSILKYLSLGTKREEPVWNKYIDHHGLGETFTGSYPIFLDKELLGVYSVEFSMNKIKNKFLDFDFDIEYYTSKGENCPKNLAVSECEIEELRSKKCFSDSKSFEAKCLLEKESSEKRVCEDANIKENYPDFYCTNPDNSYKYDLTNMNGVKCCLDEVNQRNSVLVDLGLVKGIIQEENSSSESSTADSSESSSFDSDSSDSISSEEEGKKPIVDDLITPLDGKDSDKETNPISSEEETSTSETSEEKNTSEENKNGGSNLYIFFIIVIVVIIVVLFYMRRNQPKAYLNNSNRELGQ